MNFELSEDQAMLKDTAERLFAQAAGDPSGDLWARMAELGLLAAPFAEQDGGLGLGPVETMILAEAAGRAQVLTPYASSIVAAGTALRLAPVPPSGLIAGLAAGEVQFAWGHEELGMPSGQARRTRARSSGDGWILSGRKTNVVHVAGDARLVVTATTDGGPIVLIVPLDAQGVSRRDHQLFDGTPASEISFYEVGVEVGAVLAHGPDAATLTERAREHLVAFRASEAVGLMQALLDATLEHLRTRRQFGEPLSSFQALRHKAADILVALEQARSMAMLAALSVEDPEAEMRRKTIAQVRTVVAKACKLVGQAAVQLHGGIGVTEEHPVGRGFRQLTLIDLEMERG
ncbi:acyl-CoA dehydrogenase family protein [Caulobacter rhizosphaerae]|jgi:alkylation response protein AidB-like acyl-CoA dehydrogenase|uniref:acyl-CoA dehydrogenase family protein n=1 Tax=Caulobacter rhizosphaerae TaxID=2010972 RepID=UPI0013D4C40E|nr:acyl-CoA dehydrogenase [Caulobacter rhizosphaerae]GGL46972.1 pimeloyl-CoA dehydrogenase small subunit [Caulobacter rhizosphaerae]